MNERTNKTTTTPNDPMKTLAKMVTEFNDETKKHLTLRVINKSHLGELSDVSYFTVRDTSDLLCYLVVELCLDDISEIGSVTVTHSLLRTWNLMPDDEKMLVNIAIENIRSDIKVTPMTELLMKHSIELAPADFDVPIFIITNSLGVHGANLIFANMPFNSLVDHFNKDGVIILPSSVHELLAIPYNIPTGDLIERFTQIIREVNTEQLQPNEVLSDHPYYYNHNTEKVISLFPGIKNIL